MKRILGTVVLLSIASGTFAAEKFENKGVTEKKSIATTYTYNVPATRADRLFVKNEFDFTLSANVIASAIEDDAGRYMVVGAANTNGRNVYTGSSDGGAVASCNDPLTAEDAKKADAIKTALTGSLNVTEVAGCKVK